MERKELSKLKRVDLLEVLLSLSKENEELQRKLAEAEQKLADKEIKIAKAGSMAEAALLLNGVFEAADAAASQYLENLRRAAGEPIQEEPDSEA